MAKTYLNGVSDCPVITRISNEATPVHHAKVASTVDYDTLTTGRFVGLNSSGEAVLADKDTPIPAVGCLAYNAEQEWALGNVSGSKKYTYVDMYNEYLTVKASGLALTPGQIVYLSTSGDITQTKPTSGLVQQVGIAISADEFIVKVS